MGNTWTHSEWGTFEYDGVDWVRPVDVPGFGAFAGKGKSKKGKFDLSFYAEHEEDRPSSAAVAAAAKVLANSEALVGKVANALWDDFNGRGPESGMWWHGSLDEVAEVLADEGQSAPARAEDLLPLMRLHAIRVHKEVDGYDKPIVELCFHAPFEEEHGVGVLTDGVRIVGTGYTSSVTPFETD